MTPVRRFTQPHPPQAGRPARPMARAACPVKALSALAVFAGLMAAGGTLQAAGDADRGRLLYQNHCIACHTTQIHWRANRLVTDWATLLAQVQAWQAREKLGWSEGDVTDVAHHLNTTIYRLPAPARRAAAPAATAALTLH